METQRPNHILSYTTIRHESRRSGEETHLEEGALEQQRLWHKAQRRGVLVLRQRTVKKTAYHEWRLIELEFGFGPQRALYVFVQLAQLFICCNEKLVFRESTQYRNFRSPKSSSITTIQSVVVSERMKKVAQQGTTTWRNWGLVLRFALVRHLQPHTHTQPRAA